jgi:hypothetical protein
MPDDETLKKRLANAHMKANYYERLVEALVTGNVPRHPDLNLIQFARYGRVLHEYYQSKYSFDEPDAD